MAVQITSGASDPNSVRKVVSVQAPREVAWRVFKEQMGKRVSDVQDRQSHRRGCSHRTARRWPLV